MEFYAGTYTDYAWTDDDGHLGKNYLRENLPRANYLGSESVRESLIHQGSCTSKFLKEAIMRSVVTMG